ncbi:MAG TPA: LLM class flavin-dependent oxidoreductase [Candidatus Binataceae bacterium]|nr:LLM class flavin-dependent oxidoreductase [Candidatus Binataceae bacterium]
MDNGKRKLSFGLWYDFRNPVQWRRSDKEIYDAIIDQVAWAETIGYDDVWLTEHHFVDDGHAPSPLILAAALAMRTKKIRIGTSVLLLPLYDPVRVAEDGATIDLLSGGRFELGVGVGYRREEFDGLGIAHSARGARANEGLEIIRRLWEGESVTFKSKHFNVTNARISPLPLQKPRPPIWVGGFAKASARRAARLGDGYIGTGDMREIYRMYVEELRVAGKNPEQGRVAGGLFWLVVANDPEKAWAAIAPHVQFQINVYADWLKKAGQELFPPMPNLEALKASGMLQVLTPEAAIKTISDYAATVPIERFYSWTIPPGFPVRNMDEHLELMATKVMPHFR